MNENMDKMELNLDDLDAVSGGTLAEAFAYLDELMKKYGETDKATMLAILSRQHPDEYEKFTELRRRS